LPKPFLQKKVLGARPFFTVPIFSTFLSRQKFITFRHKATKNNPQSNEARQFFARTFLQKKVLGARLFFTGPLFFLLFPFPKFVLF
jgi:hypothetical protein